MKTLEIGEYFLPDGLTLKRKGNKVVVAEPKVYRLQEYRCRDCVHRTVGYTRKIGLYLSPVCKFNPKPEKTVDGVQMYFRCEKYDKICEHFKLKTNE